MGAYPVLQEIIAYPTFGVASARRSRSGAKPACTRKQAAAFARNIGAPGKAVGLAVGALDKIDMFFGGVCRRCGRRVSK